MLSDVDAECIRDKYRSGMGEVTQKELAGKYGVSRSTISDIITGRIHKETNPVVSRTDRDYVGEITHLKEENKSLARQLKEHAKEHGLFLALREELRERVQPLPPLPSARELHPKNLIEESVVMHISDAHHDQIVTPEECGGLEEYNFHVSCSRAEQYVNTVIDWTQRTLSPTFYFPELTILSYGDLTSGEIHGHEQRSAFRNLFTNCLAIGRLHGLMIRDLAPYFNRINVVYVSGNHGRRTKKKDFHGALSNWDALCAEIAKLHCRDLDNVGFLIPDSWSVNLEINGVGFCVSHGDSIRGNLGLPFYGMVRAHKGLIALEAVRGGPHTKYFCIGHHHTASSLADIDGELLVNGAWVGTDSYAYNSFSSYREPTQLLHGVNQKGITWRMNVRLKSDNEKAPGRYSWEIV